MKKFILNNLKVFIAIILTAIICISGTVYAAIRIQADEIGYKDGTVEDALNDLYVKSEDELIIRFVNTGGTGAAGLYLNQFQSKYKHVIITELSCGSNGNLKLSSLDYTIETPARLNQEYITSDYSSIRIYTNGTACAATAKFYN